MNTPEITPKNAAEELKTNPKALLIDVREPSEAGICAIEGSVLIPLGSLPQRLEEIPKDRDIICQCKGGGRSAQATQFLMSKGYGSVRNLAGGILRWIDEVDSTLQRY